ncbi:MAG: hypothetical protein RL213_489 [Bacteroidota bacterium]
MNRKEFFCLVLTFTSFCGAQSVSVSAQDTLPKVPDYDTAYIKSFRDDLVITLVSASSSNSISATDKQGKSLTYSTNLPSAIGIGIDYKWLTAEYTSSFGMSGEAGKGYTSSTGLGFGLTGRKWWFRNFYRNTQGYFLTNPEYFDPQFDPATGTYPLRGDVSNTVYYATLNYGFNHRRFSNIAALWQLERQKKSAGSFTAGISFSKALHLSDSALFPEQFENRFEAGEAITEFGFSMYGINFGYLHTFAFTKSRKWFLSLLFIPGISFQQGDAKFEDTDSRITKSAWGLHTESRVTTGYNGDRWYVSLTGVSYLITSEFEGTNPLSQGYSFGRFAVGRRFGMKPAKSGILRKLGL